MSVVTDELNRSFKLDVKLRGLEAATRLVVEQDALGVRVQAVLPEPRHVHAWAKQMGVQAVTGEPEQTGGQGWWYRHTAAVIKRDGLRIHVGAVQMALDPDDVSMTGPVLP